MTRRIQAPLTANAGGIHGRRQRRIARRAGKSVRTAAENRVVTVRLSEFACEALCGEQAEGHLSSQAARAIRCYLNDKGTGGPGWAYPAFLRKREPSKGVEVELSIEGSLWRSLEEEAASQGVTAPQMLRHAVLYFAAEINAGRVTRRILDILDEEAEGKAGGSS